MCVNNISIRMQIHMYMYTCECVSILGIMTWYSPIWTQYFYGNPHVCLCVCVITSLNCATGLLLLIPAVKYDACLHIHTHPPHTLSHHSQPQSSRIARTRCGWSRCRLVVAFLECSLLFCSIRWIFSSQLSQGAAISCCCTISLIVLVALSGFHIAKILIVFVIHFYAIIAIFITRGKEGKGGS